MWAQLGEISKITPLFLSFGESPSVPRRGLRVRRRMHVMVFWGSIDLEAWLGVWDIEASRRRGATMQNPRQRMRASVRRVDDIGPQ